VPSLICSLKGHRASEPTITNQGRTFGRCARCGKDLLRVGGAWQTAPKGMRIVWAADRPKAAEPTAAAEAPDQRKGDRRRSEDRRKTKGPLPAFLRGRDRRSGQRDRRLAFGRRFKGE